MNPPSDLDEKPPRTILITGANGGIGQAIARSFLAESALNRLFLAVHHRHERVAALMEEFPGRCVSLELDVTKPESWSHAVAHILSTRHRLDVLVNNAGKIADGLLPTIAPEIWGEVLITNLHGAIHGCQAVLPQMITQRSGRIVNVSSLSALLAPPGQTSYAAAKAGLLAMTQSLAKEVARLNITVNAVCPGFIETEALPEHARATAIAKIPMRRLGQPEEVAVAVRFLACPAASYITGSVLKIDGGIY